MITSKDIVILNISLTKEEVDKCLKISRKTTNTWQYDRSQNEKDYNTIMGKLAEKALKNYLNSLGFFQCCFNNDNIVGTELFAFYDDFRNDDFNCHNDIDLIFSANTSLLFFAIKRVRDKSKEVINGEYFRLDSDIKKKMNNNGILICEVKSTKITNRHMEKGVVCLEKILNDDFLEYPKHCRASNKIQNLDDYLSFVNNKLSRQYQSLDYLLQDERESVSDIYFRVYIETINKSDDYKSKAYIIGLIEKKVFFDEKNITLKKMPQKNKSEKAIYFSVELRKGTPIKEFFKYKILSNEMIINIQNNSNV